MKHLILLILVASSAIAGEKLSDILETHQDRLIQTGRLSVNDEAYFTNWQKEQIGKKITVKIRWDGGHSGGYVAVKVGKRTFPVHVTFTYSGELPKKPRHLVKLRVTKCRKTGEKHVKGTRTGKEIEVTGEISRIPAPLRVCECGAEEVFVITIKAESVK